MKNKVLLTMSIIGVLILIYEFVQHFIIIKSFEV